MKKKYIYVIVYSIIILQNEIKKVKNKLEYLHFDK